MSRGNAPLAPQQKPPQHHGWAIPCPLWAAPGHVSPHSSPELLRARPAGPRLPETGRAGETRAVTVGTGTENSCRRPHSTAPPKPCSMLQASHTRSAGVQPRARLTWPLLEPQDKQRGLRGHSPSLCDVTMGHLPQQGLEHFAPHVTNTVGLGWCFDVTFFFNFFHRDLPLSGLQLG